MPSKKPDQQRKRLRRPVRQRQRLRVRQRETSCSRAPVLRMGVPVAPRNIFPSNIQGLPTWYEVRICEAGHLGARGGIDLMVAMNPQTGNKDVAGIEPGGYLLYDSTKPLPASKFRDDINVIGVPLTEICNREYNRSAPAPAVQEHHLCRRAVSPARHGRQGDRAAHRRAFKSKEKLIGANVHALRHR